MTKEEMIELRLMMREEITTALTPVNQRLDKVEQRLDRLENDMAEVKENAAITREAVNALVEWADNVSVLSPIKFPVERRASS